MNNEPLVSILIPVYMRADLAVQAIRSALNQDYGNIEIIVGDNCSPDGTFEKLNSLFGNNLNITIFRNENNLGAVGNWEECLKRAHGKYIKFLWSDDLMSKHFISTAVRMLESDENLAFAFSSVYIFTDVNDIIKKNKKKLKHYYRIHRKSGIYSGKLFIRLTYVYNPIVPVSPGCAIFRREKLKIKRDIPNKIGYIHRNNGAGTDILMLLEAVAHNEKFAYIDRPYNYFREHKGSISSFDKSISDGYRTAKYFFLNEHGLNRYFHFINSEIVSAENKKQIFNRKKNIKALSKYLDISDPNIRKHSLFSIMFHKLIYRCCDIIREIQTKKA